MEYEYYKSFFLEQESSDEDKRSCTAPRDRRSGAGDKEDGKFTRWKSQKDEGFGRYHSSQKSIPSTPIHDPLTYQWTKAPRLLKADKGVQVSFSPKKKKVRDINFKRRQLRLLFGLMIFAIVLASVVLTVMNEVNRDLTTQYNQTQEKLKAREVLLKEGKARIPELSEVQKNEALENSGWSIIEFAGSIDLVEVAFDIWNGIQL
ncbi:unnamed protein product [Orchesella dallaii]|uniref:Cell division protein FtsL n=1 Tax=Orchesella dallaii TaxID=48710 RepID=A0ABP1Q4L9_9HEXA